MGRRAWIAFPRFLLGAAALVLPAPALADVSWLEWDAPAECPSEAQIEARALSWYGSPSLPATLRVQAQLTWLEQHWHVTVQVDVEGQKGSRELDFATCSDAADFVALTAVLALRPGFSEPSAEAEPPSPSTSAPAPAAEDPSPAGGSSAASDSSPASSTPKEPLVANPPPPFQEETPWPWVGVGATGELGSFPSFAGAVRADIGISYRKWGGALGFVGFPGVSAAPPEAAAPLVFARAAGRLRLCRVLFQTELQLAPCVGLEVGAYRVDQEPTLNGDWREVVDIWVAGNLGLEASYPVGSRFRVFGEAALTVPFQSPEILLSDGTAIFRPSWAPSISAGVRLFFGRSQ